jgi:hypothetical protein
VTSSKLTSQWSRGSKEINFEIRGSKCLILKWGSKLQKIKNGGMKSAFKPKSN